MTMQACNDIIEKYADILDPASIEFCRRIFGTAPEVYANRLRAIGFSGLGHVLDAGCGFGQWALQIARMNGSVSAVDVDVNRLEFLRDLMHSEGFSPCIRESKVSQLPFEDASFDGVFSYSVIFIDDWKRCLAEFHRVLKPGGRLYLNYNEIGWFVHLWKNRPYQTSNYDPRAVAAEAFMTTVEYERGEGGGCVGQKVVDDESCLATLESLGFVDVMVGPEGQVRSDPSVDAVSFYPADHEGLKGVREVLCRKP